MNEINKTINKKWNTHKWEVFIIPEKIIKNYENMLPNKVRPVAVLSNAEFLEYKALVMECTTKQHMNTIKFYSYFNKKRNCRVTSYLALGIKSQNVCFFRG
ncbi:MAG: hypothetical protein LBL60_02140 [Mycoplasmataceae bacterium]|jgi:hypothetical protein|nr:hypothetical protein [Mycoplasmataceae bacterium]